jgi:hypothetical protein
MNKPVHILISLGYEVGLGKIFTHEQIQKAKASQSLEHKYNLEYLDKIANVFSP